MKFDDIDFEKLGSYLGDMGGYKMAKSPGRIGRPVGRLGDPASMMMGGGAQGAFGPAQAGRGAESDSLSQLLKLLDDKDIKDALHGMVSVEEMPEPYAADEIKAAPRFLGRRP